MMEKEEKVILAGLNEAQEAAVRNTEGPTLIIAGAGSGKTRVLTCRIAWLLAHGVKPWEILALTFTNKAAGEMKSRIAELVGEIRARRIWMGTFHSIFVRFLRQYADKLGYPSTFTIYDQTDSRNVIKECIKDLQLNDKNYKPTAVQNRISQVKNNLYTVEVYRQSDERLAEDRLANRGRLCDVYTHYTEKCKASGAMDFDDLLLNMNILLRYHQDVCTEIAGRFKYILVDEYQDTNYAQYQIIKRLAANHHNLCVVGDDSQSIYKFRGARIENILKFREDYHDAKLFRLEQNYRSTQTIVNAANSLIAHNTNRIPKECFSQAASGEKIHLIKAFTEQEEAYLVASSIKDRINIDKALYRDFVVLYRTNDQSRSFEQAFRSKNLPYHIYGGLSFFDHVEVKDMLAYFRLVVNPDDEVAFRRVINVPSRGIGATSLEHLSSIANQQHRSLFQVASTPLEELLSLGLKASVATKFHSFTELLAPFTKLHDTTDAFTLAVNLEKAIGYTKSIREDERMSKHEIDERIKFVEELFNSIQEFTEEAIEDQREDDEDTESGLMQFVTLNKYLEKVALMTDVEKDESLEEIDNKVSLMTVHAAKGTEFPYVYITGMEDEVFPAADRIMSSVDLEEERRLFYVAITRAEKVATLSFARSRLQWGQTQVHTRSRFLKEIDSRYLDGPLYEEESPFNNWSARSGSSWGSGFNRGSWQRPYGGNRNPAQTYPQARPQPTKPAAPQPTVHAAFSRPTRTPSANFQADAIADLRPGQRVEHDRFGFGEILRFEDDGPQMKAIVHFDEGGDKTLLLKFAKLRIVRS